MGLLDDAIREHLDLKRRRGADPVEVERLEREALGPVRREFDQPLSVAPVAGESDPWDGPELPEERWEAGAATEQEWEPATGPAHPQTPEFAADRGYDVEDVEDDEDPAAGPVRPVHFQPRSLRDRFRRGSRDESEAGADETEVYQDDFPAEEHPAPYRPPAGERDPRAYAGQETVEYDALDEGAEFEESVRRVPRDPAAQQPRPPSPPVPNEPPREDVLEETPEFLHDTPEHDRLWFEQRPPRDFDFDG